MGMSVEELARELGAVVEGDGGVVVEGIAALDVAEESSLSFVAEKRYEAFLKGTRARCIIVGKDAEVEVPEGKVFLRVEKVEEAVEKAALLLYPPPKEYFRDFISPYAYVSPDAIVGEGCFIGAFCVVEGGAVIGDGVICVAQVYIGEKAVIGEGSFLHPGVYIGERCRIGKRVVIHSNSVIGCDGFGYRREGERHRKLKHYGVVVIEDDVEVGACVCVDRARFDATRIGAGTKIDNLVHIAHNVVVGRRNLLVAQVGIAGSARLGDDVVVAGQAGVDGHIRVGNRVRVAGKAGVTKSVPDGLTVAGYPAQEHIKEKRERAAVRALPELMRRIMGRRDGDTAEDSEEGCGD